MMFGQRIFILVLVITSCFVNCSHAMFRDDRGLFDGGEGNFFRYGGNPSREIQNLIAAASISREIDKMEQKIREGQGAQANGQDIRVQRLQADIEAFEHERQRILQLNGQLEVDRLKAINAEIFAAEQKLRDVQNNPVVDPRMVDALKKHHARLIGVQSSAAQIGNIAARGIGGKTWDTFGFHQEVDGFADGIKKGLMVRITEAFGDVVSTKVKSAIDLILGGTLDFFLLRSLDTWDAFCQIMFHDGYLPFKPNEVEGWQKLIIESMKHVEKNVKDGPKDNFRGQDMTLRSFGGDDKEFSLADDSNSLSAWRMYVFGCVEQFDYFIELIGRRKKYYSDDKLIVFYAEQIQKRLGDFRDLMLKAKSVKEFDDFIESNKSLLPAMRENMEQLFKRLADEAKPRTVPSSNCDSMRRSDNVARQRPSADDDMPNRFGNQWGM